MKKILLIAFIAITGVANAKEYAEKKVSPTEKKNIKKRKRCITYGLVAWCKDKDPAVPDTVCYDTEVAGSYEQAQVCIRENGDLYNIFMCGTNTSTGDTTTGY